MPSAINNGTGAKNNHSLIYDAHNPAKPAGYLFDGDVYTGLGMYQMDKDTAIYVNEHLGILSGLYGVLKPLDLILPYRLEMGTKLKNERGDNLYEFWGEEVTNVINARMADSDDKVLINLASNEYFKSVKKKSVEEASSRHDLKMKKMANTK